MLVLALIAVLESVVHLGRIRAAVSARVVLSGFMVFCTCGLRVAFVMAGVSAVLASAEPAVAVVVYGGTAAVVTSLLQALAVRLDAIADADAADRGRGVCRG